MKNNYNEVLSKRTGFNMGIVPFDEVDILEIIYLI